MLMQSFTIEEYQRAGCFQFEVPALAYGLHQYTGGRLCNGCPKYEGGKCESLRKMLRPAAPAVQQPAAETVRQEAARRGISIGEVRRQRSVSANAQVQPTPRSGGRLEPFVGPTELERH